MMRRHIRVVIVITKIVGAIHELPRKNTLSAFGSHPSGRGDEHPVCQ